MWHKSSYSMSNGHCVEWRTSSYSAGGNCNSSCLEWRTSSHSIGNGQCVAVVPDALVRDSRLGDSSPVLRFTPQAWGKFITKVKGEGNDR